MSPFLKKLSAKKWNIIQIFCTFEIASLVNVPGQYLKGNMVFTKINFSLLTGLVIAAGILTRKEAIMIQTEIVKEIVRLQAATAYTGEF